MCRHLSCFVAYEFDPPFPISVMVICFMSSLNAAAPYGISLIALNMTIQLEAEVLVELVLWDNPRELLCIARVSRYDMGGGNIGYRHVSCSRVSELYSGGVNVFTVEVYVQFMYRMLCWLCRCHCCRLLTR